MNRENLVSLMFEFEKKFVSFVFMFFLDVKTFDIETLYLCQLDNKTIFIHYSRNKLTVWRPIVAFDIDFSY